MINVSILQNSNLEYIGFKVSGHAEYDEPGQDIVCSAVSAITITTCNSIEQLTEADFTIDSNQENGDIELMLKSDFDNQDLQLILKVFVIGITGIEESYSDYICVTFKEV